jgi:hypothetical protein
MQARLAIVTKSIQDLLNTLDSFVEQADSTSVKVKYFDNISEKYSKVKAPSLDSIDKHSVQELARNDDLEKFAMCWVSGKQVNWNLLSEGKVVRRVSLPGYQFCEQDYWVTKHINQTDASTAAANNLYKFNSNELFSKWYDEV